MPCIGNMELKGIPEILIPLYNKLHLLCDNNYMLKTYEGFENMDDFFFNFELLFFLLFLIFLCFFIKKKK